MTEHPPSPLSRITKFLHLEYTSSPTGADADRGVRVVHVVADESRAISGHASVMENALETSYDRRFAAVSIETAG